MNAIEENNGGDVEAQNIEPVVTESAWQDEEKVETRSEKEVSRSLSSFRDVFSFGNRKTAICIIFGSIFAILSGGMYASTAFFFSKIFEDLAGKAGTPQYMENIRLTAYIFMGVGAATFGTMAAQNTLFEIAASEMTLTLKTRWFKALLRQDMAYFDIKDVSGTASIISSNAARYRRGIGKKLAAGIQFSVVVAGTFGFAFYMSWKASLVILTVIPFMAASAIFLIKANQTKTTRANASYAEAGFIVYETVAAIRTVLSLNACVTMISRFNNATKANCAAASRFQAMIGLANGLMWGSFTLSFLALTLYGSYLLYSQIRDTGCDPTNAVPGNETCSTTALEVFGALMGIYFGAAGLPQISTAIEAFQSARGACYPALVAMNRKIGTEIAERGRIPEATDNSASPVSLPVYAIDSSSATGRMLTSVKGHITFREVSFSFPTRPNNIIFNGLSLEIPSGKTIALVGPSGSGKSSAAQLVERFYDPIAGSVLLDGVDLRDFNVKWLRRQIGLVSQEPVLFARSIKENLRYGKPSATDKEIERACRMANAHDFITSFPQGYETKCGDKGTQLSGGQKQRIAIARVLLKNPKILILDEATSALDSESEHVVQQALDHLLETSNRTTIVIAHRLSTIRSADVIAVINKGRIVEVGNHEELMALKHSQYRQLVEAQSLRRKSESNSFHNGVITSANNGFKIEKPQLRFVNVHFRYPSRPDNEIFRGLNLSVRNGETLALVGPSGGGKSTVVQLIERFYDPDSGSIEFNGVDLRSINVKWLRNQMSLVSQEPVLFARSIKENISYGFPEATQEDIENAARQANCHDFITGFPDGYDTNVGEQGCQVSGGQKQRISIARAIISRPKILLLDEATSALDTENEKIVQEALDKLMAAKSQTTIVIAHRLSTIRNADRIAVVEKGKVVETGTHDALISKTNGHYKRLLDFQEGKFDMKHPSKKGKEKKEVKRQELVSEDDDESVQDDEVHKNTHRARLLAYDDIRYFFVGGIGALLGGLVLPAWGIIWAFLIELLFWPVLPCTPEGEDGAYCQEYRNSIADEMQRRSFLVSAGWVGSILVSIVGYTLLFHGFGTATERMSKRIRDAAFGSLIRQEVAFFDKRSVGVITTQLQDDAALLHSFSGEPIRQLIISLSSVVVGVVISFVFMWPFALLSIGTLPFMAFGAEMEMRTMFGEDEGDVDAEEDTNSPGGLVVETLLNIRTVASLTLESLRAFEYEKALHAEEPAVVRTNFVKGLATGLGFFCQMWCMALLFWFGGWLMNEYPQDFTYRDFNIAMFSLFLGLYGFNLAAEGATNRDKAKAAASRIFTLIDRKSAIDPLSEGGLQDVSRACSKLRRYPQAVIAAEGEMIQRRSQYRHMTPEERSEMQQQRELESIGHLLSAVAQAEKEYS